MLKIHTSINFICFDGERKRQGEGYRGKNMKVEKQERRSKK